MRGLRYAGFGTSHFWLAQMVSPDGLIPFASRLPRALPTEKNDESGTSQSKSRTSVNLSNSGDLRSDAGVLEGLNAEHGREACGPDRHGALGRHPCSSRASARQHGRVDVSMDVMTSCRSSRCVSFFQVCVVHAEE